MDREKVIENANKALTVDIGMKLTAKENSKIEAEVNSPTTAMLIKDIQASAELDRLGMKLVLNDDGSVSVSRD